MANEFDDDMDDIDFDVDEGGAEDEFDDFDDDFAESVATGTPKTNIYTAMLIISAAFYILALVVTLLEMKAYCTKDFLGGIFS